MEEKIIGLLRDQYADADIEVQVEGNKALIQIAHPVFAELSRVKQQQAVYACINDLIASGELHAVTIKTSAA